MFRYFSLLALLVLSGCQTPVTTMANAQGQPTMQCGGNVTSSVLLGPAGYWFQRWDDQHCVERAQAAGLTVQR